MSGIDQLRALVQAGRYVQAAREAEELLAGELEPPSRGMVYHVLSVAEYRSDRIRPALRAAQRAEAIASEWGLVELVGRVRVNLIALLTEAGDYAAAIDAGARLLAAEGDLSEVLQREIPRAHYNLARAHRSRRDSEAMYAHLKRAISGASQLGLDTGFQVDCYHLAAWWLLLDGRITDADLHLLQAVEMLPPDDPPRQREQLLCSCLRAYQTGDHHRAVELAEELIQGGQVTTLQRAWACLIAGWVAAGLGEWDRATVCATAADNHALDLGSPELMNRAQELRIQIERGREAAG